VSNIYDIAVLGAGPAGSSAALAAAAHGLCVTMLDEQAKAGGQVWRAKSTAILAAPSTPESRSGTDLRKRLAVSDVVHFNATRVWHIARENGLWALHITRDEMSEVVTAKALILGPGAREYVQPVPGWTLPGVVGLAGATALFKQNMTGPGKRTVVCGTGPLVFYVASEIRRLGGDVAAVVTPNVQRDWLRALPAMTRKPKLLARGAIWLADLTIARVPIYWGHAVTEVTGNQQMDGVEITYLDADWTPQKPVVRVQADSLCMGHGLIPQIEAAQMLGVDVHHDPALGGWVPDMDEDGATHIPSLYLCGDGSGIRGAEAACVQGQLAGLRAATDLGSDTGAEYQTVRKKLKRATQFGIAMTALSIPRKGMTRFSTDTTIVCRCESVTRHDILAEIDRGATSTNAIKSGLRAGMGPCGGKFCQTAIAALIAEYSGQGADNVPPPTPRPPLRPVHVSTVAGSFEYADLPIPKPAPL
jgi:thioredoxin reductase/bacterioferritin-associated ferredoxin